jgi:hypothetical protein
VIMTMLKMKKKRRRKRRKTTAKKEEEVPKISTDRQILSQRVSVIEAGSAVILL